MILAIETATDVCSVAFENEAGEVFEKSMEARGSHSETLFLYIKELMEEHHFFVSDLSAVLVSEGPGSYTGLRIAASGVKGLLFGNDVPLFAVSTLPSFACKTLDSQSCNSKVHAIIDARRQHLYHQHFRVENKALNALSDVKTIQIQSFENMVQFEDIIIGTGIERLDEHLIKSVKHLGKEAISARSLIQIFHRPEATTFVKGVDPQKFDPKYYTSNQV